MHGRSRRGGGSGRRPSKPVPRRSGRSGRQLSPSHITGRGGRIQPCLAWQAPKSDHIARDTPGVPEAGSRLRPRERGNSPAPGRPRSRRRRAARLRRNRTPCPSPRCGHLVHPRRSGGRTRSRCPVRLHCHGRAGSPGRCRRAGLCAPLRRDRCAPSNAPAGLPGPDLSRDGTRRATGGDRDAGVAASGSAGNVSRRLNLGSRGSSGPPFRKRPRRERPREAAG